MSWKKSFTDINEQVMGDLKKKLDRAQPIDVRIRGRLTLTVEPPYIGADVRTRVLRPQ